MSLNIEMKQNQGHFVAISEYRESDAKIEIDRFSIESSCSKIFKYATLMHMKPVESEKRSQKLTYVSLDSIFLIFWSNRSLMQA